MPHLPAPVGYLTKYIQFCRSWRATFTLQAPGEIAQIKAQMLSFCRDGMESPGVPFHLIMKGEVLGVKTKNRNREGRTHTEEKPVLTRDWGWGQ